MKLSEDAALPCTIQNKRPPLRMTHYLAERNFYCRSRSIWSLVVDGSVSHVAAFKPSERLEADTVSQISQRMKRLQQLISGSYPYPVS